MEYQYIIYELVILVLMVLSAVFSGAETAIMTSSSIKLKYLTEHGNKRAAKSLMILNNIENTIGMTLIANNMVNISAAAFITYISTKAFLLNDSELFMVTILQTVVFLIFCEITPKVVARTRAESFLMMFSSPIQMMTTLFKPLIRFSLYLSMFIKKVMKYETSRYTFTGSREDLGMLFELSASEGLIDEEHHDYINEILSFNQVTAYEVMTPLINIVSMERKQSIRQLIKVIDETGYSRIPVYEGRVDNIIGYVYYRDMLKKRKVKSIDQIIRKPKFEPSTKKINSLFTELQKDKNLIVFIVNEFGAVEGMITMEDIAEEIVGEIQTRDHPDRHLIQKISARRYLLSGNLDINYFQRRFGIIIEKNDFETIAGFIIFHMGKIPRKGDRMEYGSCTFIVDEASDRSIEKVILQLDSATK